MNTEFLIQIVVYLLVFSVLGWIAYWICMKFFPEFPPARWVCGAVLLIVFLLFVSHQLEGHRLFTP